MNSGFSLVELSSFLRSSKVTEGLYLGMGFPCRLLLADSLLSVLGLRYENYLRSLVLLLCFSTCGEKMESALPTFTFFSPRMFLGMGADVKSKLATSSTSILSALSTLKARCMNSLAWAGTLSREMMSSALSLSIFLTSSFSFLAFQGVCPVRSSWSMTPKAQISAASPRYYFFWTISGAM